MKGFFVSLLVISQTVIIHAAIQAEDAKPGTLVEFNWNNKSERAQINEEVISFILYNLHNSRIHDINDWILIIFHYKG